jgi:hypothetical protein
VYDFENLVLKYKFFETDRRRRRRRRRRRFVVPRPGTTLSHLVKKMLFYRSINNHCMSSGT